MFIIMTIIVTWIHEVLCTVKKEREFGDFTSHSNTNLDKYVPMMDLDYQYESLVNHLTYFKQEKNIKRTCPLKINISIIHNWIWQWVPEILNIFSSECVLKRRYLFQIIYQVKISFFGRKYSDQLPSRSYKFPNFVFSSYGIFHFIYFIR